ncbi:hypothetical protein HY992_04525 [Candidatus Micrarchaeota archaeon]|nr:hypothetical protein [Candidatus Micrarchaeota archaeon]
MNGGSMPAFSFFSIRRKERKSRHYSASPNVPRIRQQANSAGAQKERKNTRAKQRKSPLRPFFLFSVSSFQFCAGGFAFFFVFSFALVPPQLFCYHHNCKVFLIIVNLWW